MSIYHKYNDEFLEEMWNELEDIPVDENECLDIDWQGWDKGTHREEIWHWFDEQHTKGVGWLMNEYERKIKRGLIMGCDFCEKIWNSVEEYKEDCKVRFKDMEYESEYYEYDTIVMFNGKPWLYITCEDHYYNDINRQINYCPICGRKLEIEN